VYCGEQKSIKFEAEEKCRERDEEKKMKKIKGKH